MHARRQLRDGHVHAAEMPGVSTTEMPRGRHATRMWVPWMQQNLFASDEINVCQTCNRSLVVLPCILKRGTPYSPEYCGYRTDRTVGTLTCSAAQHKSGSTSSFATNKYVHVEPDLGQDWSKYACQLLLFFSTLKCIHIYIVFSDMPDRQRLTSRGP